ncbi:MAG: transglycosylase domain-containing protein [Eubacteriales bacterium]|nr:transglycosylase domain-containing protein [Eubacteriales bacterium]
MSYDKTSIQEKRRQLHSKKGRVHSSFSLMLLKMFLLLLLVCIIGIVGFLYGSVEGILANTPTNYSLKPQYSATIIYDDAGEESQILSDYSSNRIPVKYDNIPAHLRNAFISIEDERFYEHNGVDLKGIFRAAFTALKNHGSTQGASTITQQLIKNNVFNVGGETNPIALIKRKLQEQNLAIQVEKNTTKEEIITNYLNTINLGKGTLGVESAAKYYFDKSIEQLTLSECAVLASITKNPSKLNPIDHPEDNKLRRDIVLQKMYEQNYISSQEYEAALADNVYERISKNQTSQAQTAVYSYFTDALITQIVDDLESQYGYTQAQAYDLVYRGGLRIHSTQSAKLQRAADAIINDKNNYPVDTDYSLEYDLNVMKQDGTTVIYTEKDIKNYFRNVKGDKDYLTIYPTKKDMKKAVKTFRKATLTDTDTVITESLRYALEPQVSYTLLDQSTGQIKVLVGGRGKKKDDLALNRATSMTRQPGSTFKILSTYAPALDTGGMTLATVFDDAPYTYENGVKVSNYEKNKHSGMITLRDAIVDSNNIVAVKALTQITPQVGYDYLLKLGFTTLVGGRTGASGGYESDINQALSLGGITDGVTNVELTAAYASIANHGNYNEPVLYTSVEDSHGNVLLKHEANTVQVMKESTAWLLTDAMKDVIQSGTGTEAQLHSDMAVAGKTGTTSNNYDFWFCGYTPYYTASIWTGYDYNTSYDNDSDYHKVIWAKIMDKVIEITGQEVRDFDACKDIRQMTICAKSGKRPVKGVCSHDPEHSMERTEYFLAGTEPKGSCDRHVALTFCSKSNRIARKFCPDQFHYQKIFRIRPDKSSGKTEDTPYCMDFQVKDYKCNVHTRQWKEQKDAEEWQKKFGLPTTPEVEEELTVPENGQLQGTPFGNLTLEEIVDRLRKNFFRNADSDTR